MLIAAPGHHATIATKIDPRLKPLEVSLRPVSPDHPPKRMMTGRVVNRKGEPVLGASVWVTGASKDGRTWMGSVNHVDKVAFTDEAGNFLITATEDFDQWELTVHARDFAPKKTTHLDTGDQRHEIRLEEGVLLTGTVVRDGEPVPNHVVCISFGPRAPASRSKSGIRSTMYYQIEGTNVTRIATDDEGQFRFLNMIPEATWYIHSDESNDPAGGYFEAEEVETGEDESTSEVGTFILKPAIRLSGRVTMLDGGALPPDLLLSARLDFGWASWQATVGPDGSFEFPALPQDQMELSIGREICRFVPGRQPFQQQDPRWLTFRPSGDMENIELVVTLPPPESNSEGDAK